VQQICNSFLILSGKAGTDDQVVAAGNIKPMRSLKFGMSRQKLNFG
jgi:hypothetical protein